MIVSRRRCTSVIAPLSPPGSLDSGNLRRLTVAQIGNIIADLFGASVSVPAGLEQDAEVQGLIALAGTSSPMSPALIDQWENAAHEIARQVVRNAQLRQTVFGCFPGTDPCTKQFLQMWGARLWRRPPTTAELDRYAEFTRKVKAEAGTPETTMQFVLAALLISPNFLYRVEIGTGPAGAGSRCSLDDLECPPGSPSS